MAKAVKGEYDEFGVCYTSVTVDFIYPAVLCMILATALLIKKGLMTHSMELEKLALGVQLVKTRKEWDKDMLSCLSVGGAIWY